MKIDPDARFDMSDWLLVRWREMLWNHAAFGASCGKSTIL